MRIITRQVNTTRYLDILQEIRSLKYQGSRTYTVTSYFNKVLNKTAIVCYLGKTPIKTYVFEIGAEKNSREYTPAVYDGDYIETYHINHVDTKLVKLHCIPKSQEETTRRNIKVNGRKIEEVTHIRNSIDRFNSATRVLLEKEGVKVFNVSDTTRYFYNCSWTIVSSIKYSYKKILSSEGDCSYETSTSKEEDSYVWVYAIMIFDDDYHEKYLENVVNKKNVIKDLTLVCGHAGIYDNIALYLHNKVYSYESIVRTERFSDITFHTN